MTLEIDQLVRIIFKGRRQTGCLDLEAIEMVVRSAMHHAGATTLSKFLQFPAPTADQRTLPYRSCLAATRRSTRSYVPSQF